MTEIVQHYRERLEGTIGKSARPDLPLAVVVGAGGLGLAVARRLGERNRLLLADRDPDALERAAAELRAGGHDVSLATCDVTDAAAVKDLAAAATDQAPVRAIAHVVGLSPSMGDWRTIMDVDLVGAVRVEEAMLDVVAPGTAAVFISSTAAHGAPPDMALLEILDEPLADDFLERLGAATDSGFDSKAAYRLAKWALNRWCRRRAAAWGERGARIVTVSPGLLATPMGALEFRNQPQKWELLGRTPLGREGTMLEIADAVDFLTSERASYITGTDLLVDGGTTAVLSHP
jgi:NAD(P)-dependent dehydrogenase (short-subunit alcohol dehydrogenase family)